MANGLANSLEVVPDCFHGASLCDRIELTVGIHSEICPPPFHVSPTVLKVPIAASNTPVKAVGNASWRRAACRAVTRKGAIGRNSVKRLAATKDETGNSGTS